MSIIEGQKINNTFFISINNPKSKNSMVLGFHPQLQSKIDEAENSKDINSIIIFGEGGFFCAGGDLNSLKTRRDMTVPERLETIEQLNGTIKKIKECSKPTIAAVEGGAAGAGVSLAMACDFLIMSDKSFLSLAYVKIGLTPDGGVTKLLAEVLPKQILSEMALIGDRTFAKKVFDKSVIVIDFGTATTLDVLNKDGVYDGGVITPGIEISLNSLKKMTAKLPLVEFKKTKRVTGTSTVSAIQSGFFWGYVSMIDGLIHKIKSIDQFSDYKVIATGGLSHLFKNSIDTIDLIIDDLTLIGLVNLFLKNNHI